MTGKRIIVILTALVMIITQLSMVTFAKNGSETGTQIGYTDLKEGHWAYNAVKWMVERKIISGYPDNTFKPDKVITRAEFSSIMVLSLGLPLKKPQEETFIDIKKDNWAYTFVESAKYYLTGFRTDEGDKFWPNREAVREDMAVALVKAKNYQNEEIDESVLDEFIDRDSISPNLRKYVAIAVKHNIMKGNPVENSQKKAFRPQNFLTRAEAAVLIYNSLESELQEEKVTYDDSDSSAVNNEQENQEPDMNEGGSIYEYPLPEVKGKVVDGKIFLSWSKAAAGRFKYYKVVVSKNNPSPRYPQDGYLYCVTDREQTSTMIDGSHYNGGDISGGLIPGQKYYFSVTSVYEDANVPGNAVLLTYPLNNSSSSTGGTKTTTLKVTGTVEGGKIKLKWNAVSSAGFKYYKVVISKDNPTPVYPEDGYLYYINNVNTTYAVIDNSISYKGGSFGEYLIPGQKYYFSITAVYKDRKVRGNAVALTFP